jgi:hypothetical protein
VRRHTFIDQAANIQNFGACFDKFLWSITKTLFIFAKNIQIDYQIVVHFLIYTKMKKVIFLGVLFSIVFCTFAEDNKSGMIEGFTIENYPRVARN